MQKRVALARAIATTPEIIFFDEPTTGLDPIMVDVINDLIIKCVRELGATALSITHDMASARKIAHRIAMLHGGRIIWHGPVAEIDRSGNAYVDQFIHGRAEGPIQMQVRGMRSHGQSAITAMSARNAAPRTQSGRASARPAAPGTR